MGTQYASIIFTHDETQKQIANKVIDRVNTILESKREIKIPYMNRKVATTVCDANPYYPAMEEHQRYLE